MTRRALALLGCAIAACGQDAPPEAERVSTPAAEVVQVDEREREIARAIEEAARWDAIPPPVEAATFDPDAFEWRVLPEMDRFVGPRATRVTIVARTDGGGTYCGGIGIATCTTALDFRVLRNPLTAEGLSYDTTDPHPGPCQRDAPTRLFGDWTIAEIAPIQDARDAPSCGMTLRNGADEERWAILRIATGPSASSAR